MNGNIESAFIGGVSIEPEFDLGVPPPRAVCARCAMPPGIPHWQHAGD
jgi:hypothetical protein